MIHFDQNVQRADFDSESRSNAEFSSHDRWFEFRRGVDFMMGFVRSCAFCGVSGLRFDLFCERCDEVLLSLQNHGQALNQQGYPFPVTSLFSWEARSDAMIRPMVYALKGGWQVRALEAFAQQLSFEKSSNCRGQRLVFVPPPARPGKSRRDHAWVFAHCLARVWGGRVWCDLRRPAQCQESRFDGLQTQKSRSRQERTRLRFSAGGAFEYSDFDRVIFVDDVVTTGATAMAVYMALGDPASFEVWTLVNRPNLAGRGRI